MLHELIAAALSVAAVWVIVWKARRDSKHHNEFVEFMNLSELRESRMPEHLRYIEQDKRRERLMWELGINNRGYR